MKSDYVTRKEIADKLELSHETVRRREHELGLHRCRDRITARPIRYRRQEAEAALRHNGHEVTF